MRSAHVKYSRADFSLCGQTTVLCVSETHQIFIKLFLFSFRNWLNFVSSTNGNRVEKTYMTLHLKRT